ncbi:MAG: hypothetical protein K5906_03110 [Bacilli bacterium]|nr:hypothetical protein [Bacilli bacterium]
MKQLFISYLFKLRHDITFKITLIVCAALAVFMSLLYFGLSFLIEASMVSGEMMVVTSLSPVQNFGIAVPVNLITFTVLEFNQGGIRNKIIGGHSKGKIYTSIFLNGLIFSFVLMTIYVLLNFAFGSAFGAILNNIHPEYQAATGIYGEYYILKMIILAVVCYISIVSFTVFFSTLFRNIGPSIPVVIISLMFCYLAGSIISLAGVENETLLWVGRIIDPLYCLGASENIMEASGGATIMTTDIKNETFYSGIASNIFYATIFFIGGLVIFKKRDIK